MNNFESIAQVLHLIKRTSGTTAKLNLLVKYQDLPGLKEVLKFIYNPYCKSGISKSKSMAALDAAVAGYMNHLEIIDYLSKNQTGRDYDVMMVAKFYSWIHDYCADAICSYYAEALVEQDLQIGVSTTLLQKVYGKDFIPTIDCMLGTKIDDLRADQIKWPCIVTEKLDGIRRLIIKEGNTCRAYSRSGHVDEGIIEILDDAARYLPTNYVYDCELLAEGKFSDNIALRQATNSISNSSGIKTGLVAHVFDMIPVDEFMAGKSQKNSLYRKTMLAATFMDDGLQVLRPDDWAKLIAAYGLHMELKHIKVVPLLGVVYNTDDIAPIVEDIWRRGGEGVMLNTFTGFYETKRVKHLIKVKNTSDYVLLITGFKEGEGKYEDSLGAIIVDYKGTPVGVGSGFTDAQRKRIWNNREAFYDLPVEITSFGESTNLQGIRSLNCPIFKRFVGEE